MNKKYLTVPAILAAICVASGAVIGGVHALTSWYMETHKKVGAPEEIEALIDKIPYVVENVVMGEEEGDDYRLVAHVVYDPEAEAVKGKTEDEIQALANADIEKINDEMPKFKRIKEVYLRTEPFEKTTTQKIKRRKVKTDK